MNATFKKLNFKEENEILIVSPPESFQAVLNEMAEQTTIKHRPKELEQVTFSLLFATKLEELSKVMDDVALKISGDVTLWICYPKKSSKKYIYEFNRDTGWEVMGEHGFEGVRQVAIDEDWSALRFRKVEYIKKMTRRTSFALTKEGKNKTRGN